jgi:hypothetical protein
MKLLRNKITSGILIASQFMYVIPVYAQKYTSEPVSTIHGRAPVASNLALDPPTPALGDTVTLTYEFSDLDGEREQGTTVQWLRDGQVIQGATAFSYTLSEAEGDKAGQRLVAEVTPKTDAHISEPAVGLTARIEATVAGDPKAVPSISDLKISGTLSTGESLTGEYTYDDNGSGSGDASTYKWGQLGQSLNVAGTDAATDNGQVPGYRLQADDAGKVMEVSVLPKNKADVTGTVVTTTTANSTRTITGGGSGGVVIDAKAKPEIRDLKISGRLLVGENLSASYAFDPKTGERTDVSTYLWGQTGTATAVTSSGAAVIKPSIVPNYTIQDTDAGKVLEVSVQAKNNANVVGNTLTMTTANSTGTTTDGGTGGVVIDIRGTPSISELKISGTLDVGKKLSASYKFNPQTGALGDTSTFKWGWSGNTADRVTSSTTVTTLGIASDYTIVQNDVNHVMEVSVRAKNSAQVVGNTLTRKSSDAGNSITGGDGNGGVLNMDRKPLVQVTNIKGTLQVGSTLIGAYSYYDNQSGSPDASIPYWSGGRDVKNIHYTLMPEDAGKTLTFKVTAQNKAGTKGDTDTMTTAQATGTSGGNGGAVINPKAAPAISDLKISGTLQVDKTLSASYKFDAKTGAIGDASTYLWGNANTATGVSSSKTAVTTSGTVPGYKITQADVGKVLEVSVQPKNGLSVTGAVVTKTAKAGGATGGNALGQVIDAAAKPSISNLQVTGELYVGKNLKGTYAYAANGGNESDNSTYAWGYQGNTSQVVLNSQSVVKWGTVPDYNIVQADVGKVLEVSVQPKNGLNVTGAVVTTTAKNGGATGGNAVGAVINPTAAPAITNLVITGKLEAGLSLTAHYVFNPNNGAPLDKSTYVWGYKSTTATEVSRGSVVATSGTVPPRVLSAADAGKVMEVSVQAKNNAATPVVGNTLTVNSSGGDTGGGAGGTVIDTTATPAIRDLKISGYLGVGTKLSANYVFDPKTGNRTDISTYVWGNANTAAAVLNSQTSVNRSGTVPDYTIAQADAGKVLEVSVRAKNGANVVGNVLTKKSRDSGNSIIDDDSNGSVIDPAAKPYLKDLKISQINQTLVATYTFEPNKGHPQDRSYYLWGYEHGFTGNLIPSATNTVKDSKVEPYKITPEDAGRVFKLEIMPRNNWNNYGMTGHKQIAKFTVPQANLVARFTKPDGTLRNWTVAGNYCKAQKARLPTKQELLALFEKATSNTRPNKDMCKRYNWPLKDACGGQSHYFYGYYWSSDIGFTGAVDFNMENGNWGGGIDGNNHLQVTCVREGFNL